MRRCSSAFNFRNLSSSVILPCHVISSRLRPSFTDIPWIPPPPRATPDSPSLSAGVGGAWGRARVSENESAEDTRRMHRRAPREHKPPPLPELPLPFARPTHDAGKILSARLCACVQTRCHNQQAATNAHQDPETCQCTHPRGRVVQGSSWIRLGYIALTPGISHLTSARCRRRRRRRPIDT